jgi:hypothetical protein
MLQASRALRSARALLARGYAAEAAPAAAASTDGYVSQVRLLKRDRRARVHSIGVRPLPHPLSPPVRPLPLLSALGRATLGSTAAR